MLKANPGAFAPVSSIAAEVESTESIRVWAGDLALTLIAWRRARGLIGTRHPRFSDLVRGPRAVQTDPREALNPRAPRDLGHNPAGGSILTGRTRGEPA